MNPQSVAPTLNVRANGKTAPGTGWENGSGFSNYSMAHSVFALMVNRILSRKGRFCLLARIGSELKMFQLPSHG